jgi:long-chain acyl-CoA synthetase
MSSNGISCTGDATCAWGFSQTITLQNWAAENGKGDDYATICKDKDFTKAVLDDITTLGRANKLTSLEIPKEATLTHEVFSPENILTPTFKLKRAAAKVFFEKEIDAMYAAF